jgi:hypothetical protein
MGITQIVDALGIALLVLLQYSLGRHYGVGPKITAVGMALLVGLVVFLECDRTDTNVRVPMRHKEAVVVFGDRDEAPDSSREVRMSQRKWFSPLNWLFRDT